MVHEAQRITCQRPVGPHRGGAIALDGQRVPDHDAVDTLATEQPGHSAPLVDRSSRREGLVTADGESEFSGQHHGQPLRKMGGLGVEKSQHDVGGEAPQRRYLLLALGERGHDENLHWR